MFNIFKQKLLKQNEITSYLKYACGEIVLIVIGILIAVSLNNWNEEQQNAKVRNGIYTDIVNDLKRDTAEVGRLLDYYNENEPIFKRVMNDTLSMQEMEKCKACLNIMIFERRFSLNTRGFSQLSAYRTAAAQSNDSLTSDITNFYSRYSEGIGVINKEIHADLVENIKNWTEDYPWFGKAIRTNKVDQAGIKFLAESQVYKNKVAYRYIIIYRSYIPTLENFLNGSKTILNQINKRLGNR